MHEQAAELSSWGDSVTTEQNADQASASAEEIWMSQWWNQEGTYLAQEINDGSMAEPGREASKTAETQKPSPAGPNESPRGIIDIRASRSVGGEAWAGRRPNLPGKDDWEIRTVMSKRSSDSARGNHAITGYHRSQCQGAGFRCAKVPLVSEADVVACDVPLLISRKSMGSGSNVRFQSPSIAYHSENIAPTTVSHGGHIWLTLGRSKPSIAQRSKVEFVFSADTVQTDDELPPSSAGETEIREDPTETNTLSGAELLKIHRQIGHASFTAMKRLLRMERKTAHEQVLARSITSCGCAKMDSRSEKPSTNRHIACGVGEVVFADLLYTANRSRSFPACLFTDSLTRFCDGPIVDSISHDCLVETFTNTWIARMGPPKRLLVDSGSNFTGEKWSMLPNAFGIQIVVAPVDIHHSIGRVGRNVQIIGKAYLSTEEAVGGAAGNASKLTAALMAHNTAANSGSSVSPMFAPNGRPGILGQLQKSSIVSEGGVNTTHQRNSSGTARMQYV